MKRVNFIKKIVLATIFAFVVCSSMAQINIKEAIKFAESIDIDFSDIPVENVCCIVPVGIVIHSIDGKRLGVDNNRRKNPTPTVITSGSHQLIVEWTNTQVTTSTVSKYFSFEAGKCYNICFNFNTRDFYFELTTDTETLGRAQDAMKKYIADIKEQQEKSKNYLAYQAANPNRLEGMWKGEKKRAMNTFFIQYTFSENKMEYEGISKQAGMRPYVMEGRLLFNENTIIFIPEKATDKGKEVKNFKTKYIWYYTVTDNVLHLEGSGLIGSSVIWETDGEFHKIK